MLRSITRSFKLINKDEFDQSLVKATLDDDVNTPKQKHVQLIIETLKGESAKVSPLDAFIRFSDFFLSLSCTKWKKTLKLCLLLHLALKNNCNLFIEAMCKNDLFNKFKQQSSSQQQVHTDDLQLFLHSSLAANYMSFLQVDFENYLFLQNALSDFDQKEESQQIFIIQKIVQMLFALAKMYKELDISLQKFPNYKLIKSIAQQLILDINLFYPKVTDFIRPRVSLMTTKEQKIGQKLYQLYSDSIRLSRNMKQIIQLKTLVETEQKFDDIKLFHVDVEKNKEIELFFSRRASCQEERREEKNPMLTVRDPKMFASLRMETAHISEQEPIQQQQPKQQQPKQQLTERKEVVQMQAHQLYYNEEVQKQQPILNKEKEQIVNQLVMRQQQQLSFQSRNKLHQPERGSKPNSPISVTKEQKRDKPIFRATNRTEVSERKRQNFDATTQFTSQQSILSFSDLGETRIMGLKRQGSSIVNTPKASQNSESQQGFYDQKQSPLGFIQFNQ